MPEKGYQFNKASVDRIGNAVRKVEGMPREPTRGSPPDRAPVPVAIIKLDAQVGPSTSTDLANGTGVLCYMNSAGDITESTQAVTAYNLAKAAATTDNYHRAQRDPLTGLWIIGDDNAGQIIRFLISAAKTKSDDTVSGFKVGWSGAAYGTTGDAIVLIDPYNIYTAPSGAYGWGVKMPDRPDHTSLDAYEMLFCESYARFIEFTLTSTFASNKATASLSTFWGDAPNGIEPSLSTVYDPLGIYSTMANGSRGHAVFDDNSTQYIVIDMDRESGDEIKYGFAYQQWSTGSPHFVLVNPATGPAATTGDTSVEDKVYLPGVAGLMPNVNIDDLVAYQKISNTTEYQIVGDYLDGRFYEVRMMADESTKPPGWRDMDDSQTGSKIDMRGLFPRGWAADDITSPSTLIQVSSGVTVGEYTGDGTYTGGDDFWNADAHPTTNSEFVPNSGKTITHFDDGSGAYSPPEEHRYEGSTGPFDNRPAHAVLRFIERIDNSNQGYMASAAEMTAVNDANNSNITLNGSNVAEIDSVV